jgi:hypothetical protein
VRKLRPRGTRKKPRQNFLYVMRPVTIDARRKNAKEQTITWPQVGISRKA